MVDPVKVEIARVDPCKADTAMVDAFRVEVVKVEPCRVDTAMVDAFSVEVFNVEPCSVEYATVFAFALDSTLMVLPVRVDKVRLIAFKDAAAELRSDK